MTGAKSRTRLLADLSLLLVAAIWGATFVVIRDALAEIGPFSFVALRFLLASATLLPLIGVMAGRRRTSAGERTRSDAAPRRSSLLRDGTLLGGLLFAGYAFQTGGLLFTSASKSGFITGLYVVIVPLVATLMTRRLPPGSTGLGVGLATGGLALLSLSDDLTVQLGDLLTVACAVAFALHLLIIPALAPRHAASELTAVQIFSTTLLAVAVAVPLEQPRPEQLAASLPAALFVGVFGTVGAYYLQTRAQRFTSATHAALIFTMEPAFAALFGYLLAGERLDPRGWLGCLLILLGMLTSQLGREIQPPVSNTD